MAQANAKKSQIAAQPVVVEEHDQNEATGVEAEDLGESGSSPYDPAKIRVDSKAFSLRHIIDMIADGDLDLAPDFQRKKVWKAREKSRLIESILLRIPLPAFYFSADTDGRLRVVDGLQRLSTVYDFVKGQEAKSGGSKPGGFALKELEYLKETVELKRYSELDATWVRRIDQTQIFVNVIDPQTPKRVKFDIFKRLNTGGTPLNGQEIRHCMSNSRSREFLKACTGSYQASDGAILPFAEYKAQGGGLSEAIYKKAASAGVAFRIATNGAMQDHVRMADREIVLRFLAFRLISPSMDGYGTKTSMEDFLSGATEKVDTGLSDKELAGLAVDLRKAMLNAAALFEGHAFRKWWTFDDTSRSNPINRALFESWSVALAEYDVEALRPHRAKIVKAARKAMTEDAEYMEAISSGTGDHARVRLRFEVARKILAKAVR